MATPVHGSVVCPVLVGRDLYVEALGELMERAGSGKGQTALVAGEAGLGKSRLVAEARARAEGLGWLILQGNCFEPDRTLPYAPFVDLLRALLEGRSSEAVAEELGPTAPELVKLLPELGPQLPGVTPTPPLEPQQEKRRLFQALAQLFTRLAARQPLALVMEDIHWCDDTSLECLLHLARRLAPHHILLVMTYRGDEVHPALRDFLAGMDRERLAVELALNCLSRTDVDAMIRAIFDLRRPARPEFLEPIYSLTDGNPFFIEEVLRALIAAGEIYYADGLWDRKPMRELHIPRSVQAAVQRRVEQLSPAASEVLALAAVAGQRFDFGLLQAVTGLAERELLAPVKELIAAQLVMEASAEQLAFRHALTRQAVYSRLLARERRALHRTIGETLGTLYAAAPEAHLADLAYHFYEAGVWDKALDYSRQVGRRAQALYAPRAAIEHFTHALEAVTHLAIPASVELYRSRGQAYETLGEFEQARSDYEAALAAAQAAGDQQAEWQALIDLGMLWAGRDYARTGEWYQRAFELARAMDDARLIAHSLNRIGNWHLNVEQPAEARTCHQEALGVFERLDDRPGIAETLDLLGMASYLASDLMQGTAYYERSVALFRELDDRQGLVNSLATMALRSPGYQTNTMVPAGASLAEATREGEAALKIAVEIGQRSGESYALWILAFCLGPQGEYARALEVAQRGIQIADEIEHRQWMTGARCALGMLYLDLLALPSARQALERALALAHEIGSLNWIHCAAGDLASVCIAQGAHERAEAVLDDALGSNAPSNAPMQTLGQRLAWCARAELALARGDAVLALDIADQMIACAPNGAGGPAILRVERLRSEALAALHRWEEAETSFLAARETAHVYGARSALWRIDASLGKLYQAERRHEDAERAYSTARAVIAELAAKIPDEGLRENFVQRATAVLPPAHPTSPRRAEKQAFGGLTAREREVARLIAQGQTNRAIADTLVVSERTVETHVSSILNKLDFTSRAQIAVWAAEKGLAVRAT